jgi:protein phosphatase
MNIYDTLSCTFWLIFATAQLQGGRKRQEDAFITGRTPMDLIAMADGLGGHRAGDEASRIACQTAATALEAALEGGESDPRIALRAAFVAADRAVRKLRSATGRRPGSTLVGGLFDEGRRQFHAANLGDSHAFLVRDGKIQWIFRTQGDRGRVDFALGVDIGNDQGSGVDVLDRPLELRYGDRILLCSDGIDVFDIEEIKACLLLPTAREACEALVSLVIAKQVPDQDNCTFVVVQVDTPP